ncbi:eukaryotic translation initiation factor eIF2A-domain-containing protein [Globomyces pollinis-pini]|nr:eukaryotic translation initiation factor eIF2A-domain-containing protein [Globomyces pollinis-pini]
MSKPNPKTQFAYLSNSGLYLANGSASSYSAGLPIKFDDEVKAFKYSPKGNYLLVHLVKSIHVYHTRSTELSLVFELPIVNVIGLAFSPNESYLSTICRYVKPTENDIPTKNMSVWNLKTGQAVLSFTQKQLTDAWNVEWTEDESYCAKLISNEVQIFDSSKFEKSTPTFRLKVEGLKSFSLSPGKRPCVAVFVSEQKGSPAGARIYDLTNMKAPLAQKSFYKADTVTFHWNNLGTNVLVFTHTDVDTTGKSYYGETNLYYLAISGTFEARVELDHAGPIHDVAWSPNSKEFIVVYGSMPAKATLFDHRTKPMYELGLGPRNTVRYSPTGRFFFVAGFGNLPGEMDIWERKSFKKIASVSASNSSAWEWCPDGRHIMTSILYRRLKVDNGIKIWHYTGVVSHQLEAKEMLMTGWRPEDVTLWPERSSSSPIPTAIVSTPTKPAGKYIPPSQRHLGGSSSVYDREAADRNLAGLSIRSNAGRSVPGRSAPGGNRSANSAGGREKEKPNNLTPPAPTQGVVPGGAIEVEKKIKSLNKKLTQIEDLKVRKATGVPLELTQLQKIDNEPKLRKELEQLMKSLM